MHIGRSNGFSHLLLAVLAVAFLPLAAQAGSQVTATGKFEGRSNHVVTGGVTLIETDNGYVVLLEQDFSLDGAPDPKLGFGRKGVRAFKKFSELRTDEGIQAYSIPASIDPKKYDLLWVWCEKFNVPLGVAELRRSG